MKFKYFLVPVLAILGCGALRAQSVDATASPSPGSGEHLYHDHWRRHHAWIWKKLNLTDVQKGQIKSIRQSLKGEMRPALLAVLKAKVQLHQDIDANNVGAIANDVSALASAETQLAPIRAKEFAQINGVLTPEQQTTLNNFKQQRAARMQNLINKLSQPTS